jgi:hypothetical protein
MAKISDVLGEHEQATYKAGFQYVLVRKYELYSKVLCARAVWTVLV